MDILFIIGISLLFYAALAFEGFSPGGAPIAVIVSLIGVLALFRVIRTLWSDRDVPTLLLAVGVLSYLAYAAGQSFFDW